jgi:hypothetical protein
MLQGRQQTNGLRPWPEIGVLLFVAVVEREENQSGEKHSCNCDVEALPRHIPQRPPPSPEMATGCNLFSSGEGGPHMSLSKSTLRQRVLRLENIKALGGRCSNPDCGWQSNDGKVGCTQFEALQFDHKESGGSSEMNGRRDSGLGLQYRVRKDPSRFQLLCANCNWIKRYKNEEARGAFQHKLSNLRPKESRTLLANATSEERRYGNESDILVVEVAV